jgi:hypothetical protein
MVLTHVLRKLTMRRRTSTAAPAAGEEGIRDYEPPVLVELGDVRDVVLGNSSSGNGDANSQYYW